MTGTWQAGGVHENAVQCPNPACGRAFTCDACLHLHLRGNYNLRYVDVFGTAPDALVDFCDKHAECTPSMLGL